MNLFNSDTILSQKRFGWIDYDRGISIILVTYRHCFETLGNSKVDLPSFPFFEYINVFLFGFRMPLFFIASGIFVSVSLQKKGLTGYLKNRVATILYPLIIWGTIQISLQMFFSSYANSRTSTIDYLNLLINPRETAQFWYLNALFFVGGIYAILKTKFKLQLWQQISLGLFLYFLLALMRSQNFYAGFIMDIMQYYIFFALGDLLSSFMLGDDSNRFFGSLKTLGLLGTAFLIIQYKFTKINLENHDNYFVEHNMPLFFLLVALVGCAFSISVSVLLKKYKALPSLRVVGYHSVYIYCMQVIAMAIARIILLRFMHISYPPVLFTLVWISGVVLPMLFYTIAVKLNGWWLFSLKKPDIKINLFFPKKSIVIE